MRQGRQSGAGAAPGGRESCRRAPPRASMPAAAALRPHRPPRPPARHLQAPSTASRSPPACAGAPSVSGGGHQRAGAPQPLPRPLGGGPAPPRAAQEPARPRAPLTATRRRRRSQAAAAARPLTAALQAAMAWGGEDPLTGDMPHRGIVEEEDEQRAMELAPQYAAPPAVAWSARPAPQAPIVVRRRPGQGDGGLQRSTAACGQGLGSL